MVGKNFGHFADEIVEEFVGFFVRGIHRWIHHAPLAFDLVGAGAAGEFGIADEPGCAVAGHVEFGDDADAALARVGDEVANFVLRVIEIVGAEFVELGEFFALDAEALIFGKVPVEDVHFYGFHAIEVAAQDVERNEVAADVEHDSAPREARLIVDRDDGDVEAGGAGLDELQKCLQAVHRAERSCGVEFRAVGGDFERVAFVFAEFLNFFAGVIGVNRQRGFAGRLAPLARFGKAVSRLSCVRKRATE